jgi:prepilin-type N-terminal cleavage/methylation domain-containing protein
MIQRINKVSGQGGFTLIELVAVMVVMAIVATFAIAKMVNIKDEALDQGIKAGINELNARETLVWHSINLATGGAPIDDLVIWSDMTDPANDKTDLNRSGETTPYSWGLTPALSATGGRLEFQGRGMDLARVAASDIEPGYWKVAP